MAIDLNLGITVTCLRTIADAFYAMHIIFKFRTAYVSPSSRIFGKGELVMDRNLIAMRYLRSDFFIDFIAALPLPQIMIWLVIPVIKTVQSDYTNNALVLVVLLQYIPRLYLIFPLSAEISNAAGVMTKTAWAGAAYNLVLYMLASHVVGSAWYLCSIERYATCWKSVCEQDLGNQTRCKSSYLICNNLEKPDRKEWAEVTRVFSKCDPNNDSDPTVVDYGMFADALSKQVASATFLEKYFYCLWWGLQHLSSYCQSATTTTFVGETLFAILIAIMGLVLFAHLIGNMQTYLQSITARLEEWRLKRRDTEEWMGHRQLSGNLRDRVRRYVQYKWLATRGVDEEGILHQLPADLRRDIQRHLCLDLVRRVPFFSQMDDLLLDAICERLTSMLITQGTNIVREGDPVSEMLFIIRGRLESSTTDGGRSGFFNSIPLRPGDFCGEELLAWALVPNSNANLPSSTRTVRALEEVEAFALHAEDLKFVANQFRRLHSKKLQHTFRLYSHHWRTWAACFIQTTWRRFKRKRMAKRLSISESLMSSFTLSDHDHLDDDQTRRDQETAAAATCSSSSGSVATQQNLKVKKFAQRFAANARRGTLKMKDVEMPKLIKPDEPDFSIEASDDEK
ncbi:Probable cyclic nucleotide-gated ion channel 14 [Linum grandiflorum]